jgi:hypothetical protein
MGGGTYAQPVQTLRDEESIAAAAFAFDMLIPSDPANPPRARDVTGGVEWLSGSTSIRLDVYRKWLYDLQHAPHSPNPRAAPALVASGFVEGSGMASGLELTALHRSDRGTLSAAYAWNKAEHVKEGGNYTPRLLRTHSLDLGGVLPLGRAGQGTARVILRSGQPFTPVVGHLRNYKVDPVTGELFPAEGTILYGPHNSDRTPFYARVDAGVRRSYPARWFGMDGSITPYLQVLNLLGARNVMWAAPGIGEGEPRIEYGPQLPFLPTAGFEWRF